MPLMTAVQTTDKSSTKAIPSRLGQVASKIATIHASLLGFKKRDLKAIEKDRMWVLQSRQDRISP